MNNEPRENLSSFMDGEVDKSAGSFLVRRLAGDSTLRETWNRYHMIRDCLREQDGSVTQSDLCARVRQAIDDEDQVQFAGQRRFGWLRPVAGVAVAATVAFVAVLSVGPGKQPGAVPGQEIPASAPMTARAEPFVSPNIGNIVPDSQPVNLGGRSSVQQDKAKAYLLRHYQVTGDGSGQGFVSLVPIVVTAEVAETPEEPDAGSSAQDTDTP